MGKRTRSPRVGCKPNAQRHQLGAEYPFETAANMLPPQHFSSPVRGEHHTRAQRCVEHQLNDRQYEQGGQYRTAGGGKQVFRCAIAPAAPGTP